MPTLLNQNGFKFFFYANEHPPAHVHVMNATGWAKIELQSGSVVHSTFKRQELARCQSILQRNREDFLEAWNDWFSR